MKNKVINIVAAFALFLMQSNFIYAQAVVQDALPQGATSVAGNVSYVYSGNTLTQTSAAERSISNFQSISVGAVNTWDIVQPSSTSISLNRVIGVDPSLIYGNINSNGRVFLINPNGILFGAGSHVDVNGLLASTLGISNRNFLNGRYIFKQKGKSTWIINQGNIHIANGGYVLLLSNAVNNSGVIQATLGHVLLATGEKMTVALDDNNDISVVINDAVSHDVFGPDGQKITQSIINTGKILAEGGMILLDAKVLNGIFDYAINNAGVIQANSLREHNGIIELIADGSTIIASSGSVTSAKAKGKNGQGGKVVFNNTNGNTLIEKGAVIDVSGGSQSGNGGTIELSASKAFGLHSTSLYTRAAANFKQGSIIIDPYDVYISSTNVPGNYTIDSAVLDVLTGNVIVQADDDIFINSDVNNTQNADFTLEAGNDINVNANFAVNGPNLTLIAGNSIFDNSSGIVTGNHLAVSADGSHGINLNTNISSLDAFTPNQLTIHNQNGITVNSAQGYNIAITTSKGDILVNSLIAQENLILNAGGSIEKVSGIASSAINLTTQGFMSLTAVSGIGQNGSLNLSGTPELGAAVTGTGDLDLNITGTPVVDLIGIDSNNGNINIKGDQSVIAYQVEATKKNINITAGNDLISTTVIAGTGNINLIANNNITLNGTAQAKAGAVNLRVNNGNIDTNPHSHVIANADSLFSTPNGSIGLNNPVDVNITGNLTLDIGSKANGNSGFLTGVVNSPSTSIPLIEPQSFPTPQRPPGNIYFNGILIWPPTITNPVTTPTSVINNSFQLSQASTALINHFVYPTSEKLAVSQVNTFDPSSSAIQSSNTGGLFLYHPLTQVNSSSFDKEFQLDQGAYDFIDGQILKKGLEK